VCRITQIVSTETCVRNSWGLISIERKKHENSSYVFIILHSVYMLKPNIKKSTYQIKQQLLFLQQHFSKLYGYNV